jgi:hypothetical protein
MTADDSYLGHMGRGILRDDVIAPVRHLVHAEVLPAGKSDITGSIRKGQLSNSWESARMTLCLQFLTCLYSTLLASVGLRPLRCPLVFKGFQVLF